MEPHLYPFKCTPLLKEKLWGGNQLRDLLGKTTASTNYGESWELASLPEGHSTIANGSYKGRNLTEMISAYAKAILGTTPINRFGPEMPLLIKFIDASKKLSVQLHPDDALAQELHHQPRGKTEMWYILQAEENAHIIVGFNEPMDTQSVQEAIANNTLEEKLHRIPVQEGDAFFIPAGLLHAIGGGIVLAEIQQTSDITYRVHDYNRKQKDGTYRELHINNAIKALKFHSLDEVCIDYDKNQEGAQSLKKSTFFTTDIVQLENTVHHITRKESFTVLICVQGKGLITCNDEDYPIQKGNSYLIPAHCEEAKVSSKAMKFLEVYM